MGKPAERLRAPANLSGLKKCGGLNSVLEKSAGEKKAVVCPRVEEKKTRVPRGKKAVASPREKNEKPWDAKGKMATALKGIHKRENSQGTHRLFRMTPAFRVERNMYAVLYQPLRNDV